MLFATSGHSGVDRVVANLLPEFAEFGIDLDLLTIRRHGPKVADLPAGIRHFELPVKHKATVLPPLVWYLRRHRPDALLTANHRLNKAALFARRLISRPLRIVIRFGMAPEAYSAYRTAGKRVRLLHSIRRWYPGADAIITPSGGLAARLQEIAGLQSAQLHVIPNPLVNARLLQRAAEPVPSAWYDESIPVVLGVGELSLRKGFDTLIRAFHWLRQQRRCRLIILGQGRERTALEHLVKSLGLNSAVRMPGYDANPYRHMARADLFVLSSRFEGLGNVLVEALACGTPVVATDCPHGPAEILQDGRVGPLVPVDDAESMARAMLSMLDNAPPPEQLRDATRPYESWRVARAYLAAMGLAEPGDTR